MRRNHRRQPSRLAHLTAIGGLLPLCIGLAVILPSKAAVAKAVTFTGQESCPISGSISFVPPLTMTGGGNKEVVAIPSSECTSSSVASGTLNQGSFVSSLKTAKISRGCSTGTFGSYRPGSLKSTWDVGGGKYETKDFVTQSNDIDGSGDLVLDISGAGKSGSFSGTANLVVNTNTSEAELATLCASKGGISSVSFSGTVTIGSTALSAPAGRVASVDGSISSNTCGAAGESGSFSIAGTYGVVYTVNVTPTTAFSFPSVTDPSFSQVCVGALLAADGSSDNGTIAASQVTFGPVTQVTDSNWAGYESETDPFCDDSTDWEYQYGFVDCGVTEYAGGEFVVPTITCVPTNLPQERTGVWVGIDGGEIADPYSPNETENSSTVEQIGVSGSCNDASRSSGGPTTYGCWYEFYGSTQETQDCPTGAYPVHPGDEMIASVCAPIFEGQCLLGTQDPPPVSGDWQLDLTDITSGWTWSNNINIQSIDPEFDAVQGGGEWIAEEPVGSAVPDCTPVSFSQMNIVALHSIQAGGEADGIFPIFEWNTSNSDTGPVTVTSNGNPFLGDVGAFTTTFS
jgi:hypothetical protein